MKELVDATGSEGGGDEAMGWQTQLMSGTAENETEVPDTVRRK